MSKEYVSEEEVYDFVTLVLYPRAKESPHVHYVLKDSIKIYFYGKLIAPQLMAKVTEEWQPEFDQCCPQYMDEKRQRWQYKKDKEFAEAKKFWDSRKLERGWPEKYRRKEN